MKKILMVLVIISMGFMSVIAAPQGKNRMDRMNKGKNHGMMFRLIESVRVDLGLTADQNTKLDQLLGEVKEYHESMRNLRKEKKESGIENFISEDFDPEKMGEENRSLREQKREEVRQFFTAKMKELHSILTQEQRQKLVDLAKEKKENFRNKRNSKRMKRN